MLEGLDLASKSGRVLLRNRAALRLCCQLAINIKLFRRKSRARKLLLVGLGVGVQDVWV